MTEEMNKMNSEERTKEEFIGELELRIYQTVRELQAIVVTQYKLETCPKCKSKHTIGNEYPEDDDNILVTCNVCQAAWNTVGELQGE